MGSCIFRAGENVSSHELKGRVQQLAKRTHTVASPIRPNGPAIGSPPSDGSVKTRRPALSRSAGNSSSRDPSLPHAENTVLAEKEVNAIHEDKVQLHNVDPGVLRAVPVPGAIANVQVVVVLVEAETVPNEFTNPK